MGSYDYNNYSVLAGNQLILNSGVNLLFGDIGSNLSISGSGSYRTSGTVYYGSDIDVALIVTQNTYSNYINGYVSNTYSNSEIGGMTFNPGNNELSYSGTITVGSLGNTIITLDGSGDYIFMLPNAGITTNPSSGNITFNLLNGAVPSRVLWVVSGNVNLQSSGSNVTSWIGAILTNSNVTMGTNSTNLGSIAAFNSSGTITLNSNTVVSSRIQLSREAVETGYINIQTTLPDDHAISINALSPYGGIQLNSGLGGIIANTTNSISLNGQAESNLTTTNGNLILDAIAGLTNIDGGSGINIGNNSTSTPIYIGTSSNNKTIAIGNNNGTTGVSILSGSGNLTINSSSTASNSIDIYSTGGINANTVGAINFATSNSTGGAITLDASFNNGGVVLSSGTQGIIISSNGGLIAIGTFSGGDIQIGTAAIARTITIGNSTSTTSLVLNSGSGGITIGNDTSSGEIQLGNSSVAKTLVIGNNVGSTRIFERFGSGGFIKYQAPETTLTDADATLTTSQLLGNIFVITPTVNRILQLPTAADIVAGISEVQVNDSIDFTIINQSSAVNQASVTIVSGTGGTAAGNLVVYPYSNAVGSYFSSGSGLYKLRLTNVTSGTEAYRVYRIA